MFQDFFGCSTCTYQYKVSHRAKLCCTQNCYQIYKNNSKTLTAVYISLPNSQFQSFVLLHPNDIFLQLAKFCNKMSYAWVKLYTWMTDVKLAAFSDHICFHGVIVNPTQRFHYLQSLITCIAVSHDSVNIFCMCAVVICISYCKTIKDRMFIGAVLYGGCNKACGVGEAF